MADFVISNLNTKDFNFESIRFRKLTSNTKIEKQWREQRYATFKAVADDGLDIKPIISNNGLIGVVNAICLLLSLALSNHVYCSLHTINGTPYLGRVLRVEARGKKMIQDDKIESFLYTAADSLRKSKWAEKTGFIPSVHYLLGGNYSELDDIAFLLTWIALEILANAYAEEQGISLILPEDEFNKIVKPAVSRALNEIDEENLTEKQKVLIKGKVSELNRPSIRNKVRKLRNAYGWDFITDRLFDDCNTLRNHIMHLGTYAEFNQHTLIDLSTRFRDSIQLALVDLLGCSNCVPDLQGLKIKIKGNE